MASKDDGKSKASVPAPVTYAGDKIQKKLLWAGIVLLVIGWFCRPGKIGGQSALPKQPMICADAVSVHMPNPGKMSVQKVRPDCLSGLVFTDDSPEDYGMNFKVYGNVDVCFWDADHCSGWSRLSVDNMVQPEAKKLPRYSGFRLIGDPGFVEIRSFRK